MLSLTFDECLTYGNSIFGAISAKDSPCILVKFADSHNFGIRCREIVGKENYFIVAEKPSISFLVYFRSEEDLNLFKLMYQND